MDIISMQTAVQISGAILGWLSVVAVVRVADDSDPPLKYKVAMAFVGCTLITLAYNAS